MKESMINLAIRYLLPRDWKYACWVDTDIAFDNDNWAQMTLNQLQGYAAVQPFQHCIDLGPYGEILQTFKGFGWGHQTKQRRQRNSQEKCYEYFHCGYAWAFTRRLFEAMPGAGLIDWMILGSADWNMACSFIGEVDTTIYGNRAPSIISRLKDWERAVVKQTSGEVGYAPGYIRHFFHGNKKKRYYETRDQIFERCGFDPEHDLGYDEQGLIRIFNNPKLEHEIRRYNRSRSEDGLDAY